MPPTLPGVTGADTLRCLDLEGSCELDQPRVKSWESTEPKENQKSRWPGAGPAAASGQPQQLAAEESVTIGGWSQAVWVSAAFSAWKLQACFPLSYSGLLCFTFAVHPVPAQCALGTQRFRFHFLVLVTQTC